MNNRWKIAMLSAVLTAMLCSSCSREVDVDQITALNIEAEIISSVEISRAVITNFEREGSFLSGDKIRVTKKIGSVDQTADYLTGNGTVWGILPGMTELTLSSGATYAARFPADYSSIAQDQSTQAAYLGGDLLVTPETSSRDGKVSFTDDKKFVHKNVKLSLIFKAPSGGSLENNITFRINAQGLRSGGTNDESIIMLRPDTDQFGWCGIAYPQGAETTLAVVLTYKGVDYKTNLSCGLVSGNHYKYTLTIHNNVLMPQGEAEVAEWINNAVYSGNFN